MKKLLIIAMLGTTILFCNKKTDAAAYREVSSEEQQELLSDEPFADLDKDEKILQLPDGSFLKGEATAYSTMSRSGSGIILNSETNPNSITVEAAREIVEEESTIPTLNPYLSRAVTPNFQVIQLGRNAKVERWVEMRPYWHSLPQTYQAAANTGGPYLLFGTGNDSALVGTAQQATSSFTGRISGTVVARDTSKYFSGINTMYTYFDRVYSNVHGIGKQHMFVANR